MMIVMRLKVGVRLKGWRGCDGGLAVASCVRGVEELGYIV